MSDDTIRAALEAATRTGCNCDCATVQPGCRRQMAEEIAAFLRALPNGARAVFHDAHAGQITSRPGIGQTGAWWAGHLAAAVEEAAHYAAVYRQDGPVTVRVWKHKRREAGL